MKLLKLIINNSFKKKEKKIFFVKEELQSILNLYSKMVRYVDGDTSSSSEGSKEISFDVYQRTSDIMIIEY